jgi:hypothetical protein
MDSQLLSVLVGCYGNHPEYSMRAVESVVNHATDRSAFKVYVGCNACCPQTVAALRSLLDRGGIDALAESPGNINKDPMMRVLLEFATTPYVLWMDDDSHVLPGWDTELLRFIRASHPFDVAGHVFFISNHSPPLRDFLRKRPWFVSEERVSEPIWFATGGFFVASAAFLRIHHFPDRAMIKRADDVLLGDLLQQQKGVLRDFGKDRAIMDRIRISDGNRRGAGEGADGWLAVNPLTGEKT